jgi:tRNA pseudouridine38-40 synthase
MKNLLFKISYDGTNYHGFQTQHGCATIQGTIERVLSKLTREKVIINGCGRTDSGVHAINYYFNVLTNTTIPASRFPIACASYLPDDIVVISCVDVPLDFNARFHTKSKTYIYKILNRKIRDPLEAKRSFFFHKNLDVEKMQNACKYIIGEKDFKSFMCIDGKVNSTIRNIMNLEIEKKKDFITVKITANGFLYNMVRIIVGTLISIGTGRITNDDLIKIIKSKNRENAGVTVPPHGLYLYDVYY